MITPSSIVARWRNDLESATQALAALYYAPGATPEIREAIGGVIDQIQAVRTELERETK